MSVRTLSRSIHATLGPCNLRILNQTWQLCFPCKALQMMYVCRRVVLYLVATMQPGTVTLFVGSKGICRMLCSCQFFNVLIPCAPQLLYPELPNIHAGHLDTVFWHRCIFSSAALVTTAIFTVKLVGLVAYALTIETTFYIKLFRASSVGTTSYVCLISPFSKPRRRIIQCGLLILEQP